MKKEYKEYENIKKIATYPHKRYCDECYTVIVAI